MQQKNLSYFVLKHEKNLFLKENKIASLLLPVLTSLLVRRRVDDVWVIMIV